MWGSVVFYSVTFEGRCFVITDYMMEVFNNGGQWKIGGPEGNEGLLS